MPEDNPLAYLLPGVSKIEEAPTLTDASHARDDLLSFIDETIGGRHAQALGQKAALLQNSAVRSQSALEKAQTARKEITAAQNKRAKIEKYPTVIADVLGFFDQEYDWEYWNNKIRQGKQDYAGAQDELNMLRQVTSVQNELLDANIQRMALSHQIATSRADRAFDTRQLERQEELTAVELSIKRRQEARAEAAAGREQIRFQRENLGFQISTMSDEELKAASQGKVEGIPSALAIDEGTRRRKAELELIASEQANESGEQGLRDYYRQSFLSRQGRPALEAALADAQENGGSSFITIGNRDIEVTQQEITRALAGIAGEERAAAELQRLELDARSDFTWAQTEVQVLANQHMLALGSQAGTYAQKFASIDQKYSAQIRNAATTGNYARVSELSEAWVKEVQAAGEKDLKEIYTDKQMPLVNAYMTGRRPTRSATYEYLGWSILDQTGLTGGRDEVYNVEYQAIATAANDLLEKQGLPMSGGQVTQADVLAFMTGQKPGSPKMEQVIAQAVHQSGARELFQREQQFRSWQIAFKHLKDMGLPGLENITTIKADKYYLKNDDGSRGEFSDQLFLQDLHERFEFARTLALQEDPEAARANPNLQQSYANAFLEYMATPQFQNEVKKYYTTGLTPTGYAIGQLLYGDDPMVGFRDYLANLEATWMQDFTAAKAEKEQTARENAVILQTMQGAAASPLNIFSGGASPILRSFGMGQAEEQK